MGREKEATHLKRPQFKILQKEPAYLSIHERMGVITSTFCSTKKPHRPYNKTAKTHQKKRKKGWYGGWSPDGHEDYIGQLWWDVPEQNQCAGQPTPGSGPRPEKFSPSRMQRFFAPLWAKSEKPQEGSNVEVILWLNLSSHVVRIKVAWAIWIPAFAKFWMFDFASLAFFHSF